MYFVVLCAFFSLYCTSCSAMVRMVSESQILGLQYLYNDTLGDSWLYQRPGPEWEFSPPTNPCSPAWQGVICDCVSSEGGDEECFVTALNLEKYHLQGVIPDQLSLLSNLTSLRLSENHLNGTNLTFVCGLPLLVELRLHTTRLQGSIPTCLVDISNFQQLDLDTNNLSGTLPGILGSLASLSSLDLGANPELTGTLPTDLCNAVALKYFKVNGGGLSGTIPSCLWQQSSLTELSLAVNRFTGALPSDANLPLLRKLHVDGNLLTGTLPASLLQTSLTLLTVNSNQFTGTLPVLPASMVQLAADYNSFTGSLFNMRLLPNVQQADFSLNFFSGSLPQDFGGEGGDRALQEFLAHHNFLTGQLPESLGNISGLIYLSLDNNMFTGGCLLCLVRSVYIP